MLAVLRALAFSSFLITSIVKVSRISVIALMMSSGDDMVVVAMLALLGFVVLNTGSFFFGAIVASLGAQHACVGVRATMLLLEKGASPSSATLQSELVFVVGGSWVAARLGLVVVVV
jgi:hypothetical protein